MLNLVTFLLRLSGQKQSFAKQLLMEQKKMETIEKLKQKQTSSPRIGRGFDSGLWSLQGCDVIEKMATECKNLNSLKQFI